MSKKTIDMDRVMAMRHANTETPKTVKQQKHTTMILSPAVRALLIEESGRRKLAGDRPWPVQRIVEESVLAYLRPKK